jgi:hypothetical protein
LILIVKVAAPVLVVVQTWAALVDKSPKRGYKRIALSALSHIAVVFLS